MGVLYYELLKPGATINGERYRTQLIPLKRAIAEKRPEYATRHEAIIFHHDNARPYVDQCSQNVDVNGPHHGPYQLMAFSSLHCHRWVE